MIAWDNIFEVNDEGLCAADEMFGFGHRRRLPSCFSCGDKLSFPFVFWKGCDDGGVSMCHDCAAKVGAGLISDAFNLKGERR